MSAPAAMTALDALAGVAIASSTFAVAVATLLALAITVTSVRMLVRRARMTAAARPRAWRTLALLLLQAASATLLYLLLFPPAVGGDAGTLVVRTRDAGLVENASSDPAARVILLPEAGVIQGTERMPDLATALRRWPGTTRLQVVGAGLVARDRDAAIGRPLAFAPSPLPRGVVALQSPPRVQTGRRFTIAVDVHALPGGTVELLDPAGAMADRAAIAASAAATATLRLGDLARSAGLATWRVRLRDAARREVQTVAVPLQVDPGTRVRVLMLAGAPNAELKYLRRWATDGGLVLDTRIGLGGGLQVGDASARIDDAALADTDLLVLDQRTWQTLGDARRAVVNRAVSAGMGLLLRLPETLSAQDATRLRSLGFATTPSSAPTDVRLAAPPLIGARRMADAAAHPGGAANEASARASGDGNATAATSDTVTDDDADQRSDADATAASSTPREALPAITRSPTRIAAVDGVPLLRDAAGTPLALWRAQGRGRIGVASIGDTWRLVLTGHADAYDQLWSPLFETLARATRAADVPFDSDARVDQRIAICGIGDASRIEPPSATSNTNVPSTGVPLRIDPRTGTRRCAAYWPRAAGWHRLRDGDRDQLFHVRAADAAPGINAALDRRATQALVGDTTAASASTSTSATPQQPSTPGPRWPWLIGWLVVSALLWWLERSRVGRTPAQ